MVSIAAIAIFAIGTGSTAVHAWGFAAHRFIADKAIDLLPPEIRPFYDKHRGYLVEHSIDPDLWRSAGFDSEPPRHFVDLDAYGAHPFHDLPRDHDRAVEKFGPELVTKNGLLPWRTSEIFGRLHRAFAQQSKGGAPFALEEIKFFSAVIAHYVADAHQPFHATLNYDGQLTKQHGIHARFETELFERFQARLAIHPPPLASVSDPRQFIFDALLGSFQLVEPILQADRAAIGSRDEYDDRYFTEFLAGTRPILERRLGESISGVASMITAAWTLADKPRLAPAEPKPIQKVRRPSP